MPPVLRALCVALSVLLAVHACTSPFVEEGMTFLFSIAVDSVVLWLIWAFTRRQPNTLIVLSAYCVVANSFSLLFFPRADEYGHFLWLVRAQFVSEFIVCAALFVVLRQPSTASWFAGEA